MPRTLPPLKGNEKVWNELLPAEHLRKHGRWVYMFRNTLTNQIVYTPKPRIEQRTLRQLPFIGKHSVPARIRQDLWTAHCRVGPFPTPKQGLDVLKKLRELRKLHEVHWDVSNPEIQRVHKKKKIRMIMNQRKNAAADLAKVLQIHDRLGRYMKHAHSQREKEQQAYREKKWAKLKGLAKKAEEGHLTKMEERCEQWGKERESMSDSPEAQQVLDKKIKVARKEIWNLKYAQRMVAKLAAEEKYNAKIDAEVAAEEERNAKRVAEGKRPRKPTVKKPKRDFAFRSLPVPEALKPKQANFSLDGVEVQWADLVDAEYAAEWPSAITHDSLNRALGGIKVQTEDEYAEELRIQQAQVEQEAEKLVAKIKRDEENKRREEEGLPPLVDEPVAQLAEAAAEKTGLAKYTSWIRNPFKRASA